jgi:hypothetical protein
MRRFFCYVALVLFVIYPTMTQVAAQDGPSPDCGSQDMVAAIEAAEDML